MRQKNEIKDIYIFYQLIKFWSFNALKKVTILLFISLYFIVLFCMVIFVPLMIVDRVDVLFVIKNPIASSILVFISSILMSVIANQIFKSSIEDGTEILLLSKSMTKRTLFLSKLSSFLILVLLISIVSAIIVSFVSLINNVTNYEIYSVVFGVLTATMINGLLFGSLTLIFVCYFKKITITILMLFINFVLCVFSLIIIFKGTNALIINNQQDDYRKIKYVQVATLLDDNKIKFMGGIINDDYINNPINILDPKDLYIEYENMSTLHTFSGINLYGQLSNMYALNNGYYNPIFYFWRSNNFIENNKVEFLPKVNTTTVSINMNFLTDAIGEKNINYPLTAETQSHYRFGSETQDILDSWFNIEPINIEKLNYTNVDETLFNKYWDKYGNDVINEYDYQLFLIKNNKLTKWDFRSPLAILLRKIAIEIELDKTNYKEFNNIMNDLMLSAYYEFLNIVEDKEFDIFNIIDFFNVEDTLNILEDNDYNLVTISDVFDNYKDWSEKSKIKFNDLINEGNLNKININENTLFFDIQKQVNNPNNKFRKNLLDKLKNKTKYFTLLNSIGIEIQKWMKFDSHKEQAIDDYSYLFDKFFDTDHYDIFYIPKKYTEQTKKMNSYELYLSNEYSIYDYFSYLNLTNSNFYNNFYPIEIVSLYNSKLLYPFYVLLSIFLIVVSFAIYMKKDFN